MREVFDIAIHDISVDFLRMQSLTLEQISKIRSGLASGSLLGLRQKIKTLDLEVDRLEIELEASCLNAIARHQPMAKDLRFFLLILKSLTDLERVGDYAVHIAADLEELAGDLKPSARGDVLPMLGRLADMLERMSYAYTERDLDAANLVREMDDDIDSLYEQLQRSSLTRILEDPRSLSSSLKINRMARSLERLGDHIVNIAKRIGYWETGKR